VLRPHVTPLRGAARHEGEHHDEKQAHGAVHRPQV
jgi:hypothetical protein